MKNRFLILLVYYRLYITYTLADGFLFDLDQSNICSRDIQKIESLVRQCLPIPDEKLYKITKKRLRTPDEKKQYFPAGFLAFIDSTTEPQQIPRPVDKRIRKAYYSGKKKKKKKKKRHTVKTQR